MSAAKRKFFKKTPPKQISGDGPKKEESLAELKEKLSEIHSKIEDLEWDEQRSFEVAKVETEYDWNSPSHVFIPRGAKWITYVVLLTILIILVLLFFREFFIIAPVLAVAFIAYVLASVPPENIEHRITNQGIISGKHNYLWGELYDFWFTEKHGSTVLNIETKLILDFYLFLPILF